MSFPGYAKNKYGQIIVITSFYRCSPDEHCVKYYELANKEAKEWKYDSRDAGTAWEMFCREFPPIDINEAINIIL